MYPFMCYAPRVRYLSYTHGIQRKCENIKDRVIQLKFCVYVSSIMSFKQNFKKGNMIYYGNKCFTHAMSKHDGNVYQDKIVQFQMNYIISRPKFFVVDNPVFT